MAEGARLESVYTATYRGFESLSLRQIQRNRPCGGFFVSAERGLDENPKVRQNGRKAVLNSALALPEGRGPWRARVNPSLSARYKKTALVAVFLCLQDSFLLQ